MSDVFHDLNKAIRNVASRLDILLFEKIDKKKHSELLSDVFALACIYEGVYRKPCSFFISILSKESTDEKAKRKDSGSYFTPPYIAEFIVKQVIGPHIDVIEQDETITDKVEKICDITICDPSMGGGIFLIEAHDYLVERLIKANAKQKQKHCGLARRALMCLYGVDINPNAVEGTKTILQVNLAKWLVRSKLKEFAGIAE